MTLNRKSTIDRFAMDRNRIQFLPNEDYIDEVFFTEEERKVAKDNTFRFDGSIYEAPVHLREQKIQIRFHPKNRDKVIVFFKDQKMGYAQLVDQYFNAKSFRKNEELKNDQENKAEQDKKETKDDDDDNQNSNQKEKQ